jgi:hypothetical protein
MVTTSITPRNPMKLEIDAIFGKVLGRTPNISISFIALVSLHAPPMLAFLLRVLDGRRGT